MLRRSQVCSALQRLCRFGLACGHGCAALGRSSFVFLWAVFFGGWAVFLDGLKLSVCPSHCLGACRLAEFVFFLLASSCSSLCLSSFYLPFLFFSLWFYSITVAMQWLYYSGAVIYCSATVVVVRVCSSLLYARGGQSL